MNNEQFKPIKNTSQKPNQKKRSSLLNEFTDMNNQSTILEKTHLHELDTSQNIILNTENGSNSKGGNNIAEELEEEKLKIYSVKKN